VLTGAKFCHNCGYSLAAAADPSAQDRLQKFIPRELLIKLQAARSGRSMEGERRIVTMLFCDVKGSTAMAEILDPEEWAEIMNGAFEYLIPPVFRYEGTIPRLMGDAILAFFGAPIAHEDDPERAVRAGLEIVEGIRGYRQAILRERGLDFDVRVGINTGLVVVGAVGSDLRLEYTAMGDAINLAARMEQTARPGTVQITDNTYRLVAPLFEVEPLGGIEVKGKSEPVEAYRVIGLKAVPTRMYGIAGAGAPLVGREKEMSALRRTMEEVRNGRGGIVFLIGDAGFGKTRLITELQREWEASFPSGSPGAWDVVSAASFAASRPYGQFRQHLVEHMGIRETDPPEVVHEKIYRMYDHHLAGLRDRAVSVYSRLLGIEEPGARMQGSVRSLPLVGALPMEGEAFKQELFDLVLSFQRIWLGGQPGVQVFDDVHWTDPSSAELLIHLLQLTREAPILFLLALRPEPDTPAWSIRDTAKTEYAGRYAEIVLGPLTPQESKELMGHLLSGSGSPPNLLEQILEKAEGNPLFIEEVVRELLDQGELEQRPEGLRWVGDREPLELAIPESLHALLTARLDRLEEDARRTLQLASVIGRSFYYEVLKRIIDAAIELDRELQKLQLIDMIREAARQPELEYQFRHALTQEAAYRSILVRRRREYHRRVAEVLETLFSDRLEDHAALLAHHFDAAGDSRARQYYHLAGRKAAQIYASLEALVYYDRALQLPVDGALDEDILIYEARGEIYFSLGRFEQALADFEAALQLAREAGRTGDENRMMSNLAWLRWSSGRGDEALELAREAEAKSLAAGDPAQALRASIVVGTALQNLGDLSGARVRIRRAWLASRRQGLRQGMPRITAFSLHFLAMLENFAGRFGRSAAIARRAYEIYLGLGDRLMACGALFYGSLAEGGRGRYDQALALLEDGRLLAEQISSPWLARYPNQRAWLSAELGDWESAYEIDLAGLQPAQVLPGFREIEISTLINLVLDCIALGRLAEAEMYLAESQKDLGRPEYGSHNWRWSLRLADARARLQLAHGDLDGAAGSIATLLEQAARLESRKYTLRGLLLRARTRLAERSFPDAEAGLLAACRLADSLCYPPGRFEARLLLAHLYRQSGSSDQAKRRLDEASNMVADLDRQLRHPELRSSFERGIRSELQRSTSSIRGA
jgi:class 3 adenylate cyclase/tetratricopeptide (TPR) repeat protein